MLENIYETHREALNKVPFSELLFGKNKWKYRIKDENRVCTILRSLKVNIWSELLYSTTQPEPVFCLSNCVIFAVFHRCN